MLRLNYIFSDLNAVAFKVIEFKKSWHLTVSMGYEVVYN